VKVSVGPYTFDNVSYDVETDVLYLHIGDPSTAADFDESPEGHGLRFGVEQNLVGVTIVGVKSQDGQRVIVAFRPEQPSLTVRADHARRVGLPNHRRRAAAGLAS
jgi:uncharacterized protein YuzE